jgi:hypothetical protein
MMLTFMKLTVLATIVVATAACSSQSEANDANTTGGKVGVCDSLQISSTDRVGAQVVSTLFRCDLNTNQEVITYASKDSSIVMQKFRSKPDSMIYIIYNPNGSIWSRTTYLRSVPVGGVYCTAENGDTIQYYYHSEHNNGQIAFTALRNAQSGEMQYTGNPVYYIALSSDKVRSGDSVWVDIKVCDLQWVSRTSSLVESMSDRNERLTHEPFFQNASESSYLLIPNAVGIHTYSYEVELKGRNGSTRFNRTFAITVGS